MPHPGAGEMGGAPTGMTPQEREARSRLGRYLRRSAFPADREALLEEAAENEAPEAHPGNAATFAAGPGVSERRRGVGRLRAGAEDELEQRF